MLRKFWKMISSSKRDGINKKQNLRCAGQAKNHKFHPFIVRTQTYLSSIGDSNFLLTLCAQEKVLQLRHGGFSRFGLGVFCVQKNVF